jgi:cob(I)alamin adenosyltransferase
VNKKLSRGMIYVYTGDGKGKTTAALGLSIRAAGQNMKVAFIQFIKGVPSGEILFTNKYNPFEIIQLYSGDSFSKPFEQLKQEAQKTFSYARETLINGSFDLVIFDEILVAINKKLITTQQVLDLLDEKPDSVELVLTGRNAPQEIMDRADLVTDMHMIKHPYTKGITGKRGIEY